MKNKSNSFIFSRKPMDGGGGPYSFNVSRNPDA